MVPEKLYDRKQSEKVQREAKNKKKSRKEKNKFDYTL